ncbi:protocatechuate 3,4-dioxygenase subunit alpha [Kutzneria viridogrisea]|uniref:Protocatechuate 3,4-dioxygenase alpha chain n=2 Tax=Kutzneria TaxID=43356 RepID=W5W467_9PSEU|nr:protocatechuate 3,4-dioxygenase subunit alpha [Kutzneria albida]AHH95580.1 protocatechuate 3,4-dioxygenase alpha chain [Kutzneria albida DSM 43870]MBA8927058.1 protocatechuate 3,4-dioxygenase alpha subunit [Kutzneria viridogrisea]
MTTPSQTVGPFFALPGGIPWPDGPEVVPAGTPGAVLISGTVLDGAGAPVPDAVIETWQASPTGRFAHPDDPRGAVQEGFRGFGRCATDAQGRYWVRTVKPGALPTADGQVEAPHLDVSVLARGLLNRLVTRIYFPDEPAANAADPVLAAIADPAERASLVAVPTQDGLRFDIRLQGEGETTFFEV